MGKIPEGWLPYSPIGNQVPGTRFIAFKVPLREDFFQAYVDKLKPEDRFTINLLLDKIPDLGLVIDLTHTTKYYNKRDFLDRGVDYVKIQTPGQVVPPQHLVEKFFEVIDYYLDTHKNDNTLIGVHCTHGVNRTGYMLCRYLIQRLGYTFNEAIEAVGRARGHMIERSPYLTSLQANREAVKKKPMVMRGIEESKTKISKKEEVTQKKEDASRRGAGKDGFRGVRGDYHSSAGGRAPSGRQGLRISTRSPPLQQSPRGHSPPVPVRGRTPPIQPMRSRPSPSRYDRPVINQSRDRTQPPVIRERIPPPMTRGRSSPNQLRGRTPPLSFRSRSPPIQMSHHSPQRHMRDHQNQMRSRASPHMIRGRSPTLYQGRGRSPPSGMMGNQPTSSRGRLPPSPPHMRGRSPPHMRGPSPSVHMRSRSPQYRSGRTPPPHSRDRSPIRVRSPGRSIRGRTPPPYDRPSSPGQIRISRPPTPTSAHGHISRRDQLYSSRGRSPPVRGRSPVIPTRRERSPPQIARRPPSPDFRRNEQSIDRHYGMRSSYEDNRRAVEEPPREYNERFHSSNPYINDNRGYGVSNEYYPERYEKPRRERSLSPRRHHSYYPNQKEEMNNRSEYSPSRETKRRRKTSPTGDVREREKPRRSSPPSGYINSRDDFKKEKREHSLIQWDHVKDKDGPDCREILNEKRSMRDTYPDSQHMAYPDASKFPPSSADLREALEEEKRRRHGHGEQTSYRGQDSMDNRSMIHHDYPTHGYPYRAEGDVERGRSRQDYGGHYDNPMNRSDNHRHASYQDPNPYVEPINVNRQDHQDFVKPRDDEFRKSRGRRGKRVFDRLRGGRGRGGGGYWT